MSASQGRADHDTLYQAIPPRRSARGTSLRALDIAKFIVRKTLQPRRPLVFHVFLV